MKKLMFLLMLFLTSQMYGQTTRFDAKYKIFCIKEGNKWGKWSDPMKIDASIIINGEQIVISDNNKSHYYQFFYLHNHIKQDNGVNTQNNDIYESNTYISTDRKCDSLYITIYNYNSGEHALSIILPKEEYVYFTRKPHKE
jgi:hypothetical protein